MSVENLTSVVTDPYHMTDPEHGFTVHDPEAVAFVFAPVFPTTARKPNGVAPQPVETCPQLRWAKRAPAGSWR